MFGLPQWLSGKESACQCRRHGFHPWVRKIPLEKEMATHSSILYWEISWTEEPDRLQSMELQSQIRLSNETTATVLLGMRTNAYFPLSALVYTVNSVFFFFFFLILAFRSQEKILRKVSIIWVPPVVVLSIYHSELTSLKYMCKIYQLTASSNS